MRCFVFGTGRCGFTKLTLALNKAVNYNVTREVFCSLIEYPDCHIEVNPQLRIRMDELVEKYPEAIYVWLFRDTNIVTKNFLKRNNAQWLNTWWDFYKTIRPADSHRSAEIAVRELEKLCNIAWGHITQKNCLKIKMDIDNVEESFAKLWTMLKCEGDFQCAINLLKS
ncbi:MAG TPA: hypothetical protein DDX98_13790 [Bacteroidales bacterium]|nr:hypothetical protein [Bacteroidales bacterium]